MAIAWESQRRGASSPMRIFLSSPSVEGGDIEIFDRADAGNRLTAFPLIDAMTKKINMDKLIKRCKAVRGNGQRVMFDSGIASLNFRFLERSKSLASDGSKGWVFSFDGFRNAAEQYVEAVSRLSKLGLIDYCIELDVDHFIGWENMLVWRKQLKKVAPNLIPVWRISQGKEEFFNLIDEFKYIAINIRQVKGVKKGRYEKFWSDMLHEAYRRGGRVHVFATVREKFLLENPVWATDCSSWSMGRRWGIIRYQDVRKKMGVGGRPVITGSDVFSSASILGMSKKIKFDPFSGAWWTEAQVRLYVAMEKKITDIWNIRGVVY